MSSLFTYAYCMFLTVYIHIIFVNANGYMIKPLATYYDYSGRTNYITRVDAKALFKDYIWDYSPSENAKEYQRLVDDGRIIQPLSNFMNQYINGCPMNDLSAVASVANSSTMEFLNDQAHEGLVKTHSGPCEIWIDNERVFSDMNCAEHYTSYPAALPVDYSKCKNDKCLLSFYWLTLHEPMWQLFKHCATITKSLSSEIINSNIYTPVATYGTRDTSTATHQPEQSRSANPPTTIPTKRCKIRETGEIVNMTMQPTSGPTVAPTNTPSATTQATDSTTYNSDSEINIITNNFIVDAGADPASRGVEIRDNYIKLNFIHSPRIYMLDKTSRKYQMFNMNGKKLSFDVELENMPCDYNLALYFSEMKQNNNIGSGYCDAQGQGYACSEMDIFEGNVVATHLTSHPCQGSNCDRDGAMAEAKFNPIHGKMHVETKFFTDNNKQLTYIEQIISYNQQMTIISIKETNAYGGLKQMGEAFNNGMVFILSIWTAGSGGMSWLNGHCNSYNTNVDSIYGTFSNIIISNL